MSGTALKMCCWNSFKSGLDVRKEVITSTSPCSLSCVSLNTGSIISQLENPMRLINKNANTDKEETRFNSSQRKCCGFDTRRKLVNFSGDRKT